MEVETAVTIVLANNPPSQLPPMDYRVMQERHRTPNDNDVDLYDIIRSDNDRYMGASSKGKEHEMRWRQDGNDTDEEDEGLDKTVVLMVPSTHDDDSTIDETDELDTVMQLIEEPRAELEVHLVFI